jgi:hypothetical protein
MLSRLLLTLVSVIAGIGFGGMFWNELPVVSVLVFAFFLVIAGFCLCGTQEEWNKWFGWLT